MRIDVIVPIYNGGPYIEEFFRMFNAQADAALRLILVDDGSTDGSGALLERMAVASPIETLVLHQPNGGISQARNLGLAHADGDWVAFFDVDDGAAPDYVAFLKEMAARDDFDCLVFAQRRVKEGEPPAVDHTHDAVFPRSREEQLAAFLADPTRLGVYNLLLRRDLLERAALRFPESYNYYEDYDFLYRTFGQAEHILCTDKAIYDYVQHSGSAMNRFNPERLRCLRLMEALEPWFQTHVPAFAPQFQRWGVARIYWSILWQAALAAPSYGEFQRFARRTFARIYLRQLRGFPDRLVQLSRRAYLCSPLAFYWAVQLLGRHKSKLEKLPHGALESMVTEMQADPRRILAYGMTHNPGGIESYLMSLLERGQVGRFAYLCDFASIAHAGTIAAHGCAVHFIPAKSKDLKGHLAATARVLRQHPEYVTVYFNVLDAGCVVTALVPWLHGRRVAVHSHNSDTDKLRLHRLTKPFLNGITQRAAACSHLAADHMFSKKRAAGALIIPNAIDAAAFRWDPALGDATRRALGVAGKKVLFHAGRLTRQKNPLFLLDIFAALRRLDPDWVLVSAGTGDLEDAFLARIRELGLADAVLALGVRSDVPALMQAADAFILPSLYEGLPIVGVEAQAAGLPCLFSDAVTEEAAITDLVRFHPVDDTAEGWARAVAALPLGRRDTFEEIRAAGYDKSCCTETDRKLRTLLLN